MKTIEELIKIHEQASCGDPFECIYRQYGQNKNGHWGCFAKRPNGDPEEEEQPCIAQQTLIYLRKLKTVMDFMESKQK